MTSRAGGTGRFAVVVPAFNAAGCLGECLASLAPEIDRPEQIIVVDDGSADDTVAIARSFGVTVHAPGRLGGPAAVRNVGAALTGADILIFVDADVVVAPGSIAALLAQLASDPNVAAVFGSYDDQPQARAMISRYRNLLHHWTHQTGDERAATFWAGFGAVRRDAFEAVGRFDPAPELNYIEDIELGYRLRRAGFDIRLNPSIQCKHLKRWTLWSMIRTDTLHRALPWSRLLLAGADVRNDLNLSVTNRAAVGAAVLAAGLLVSSLAQPWLLLGAALMVACLVAICRDFFLFLTRSCGLLFAAGTVPLHAVHYVCGAAGFVLAVYHGRRFHPAPLRAMIGPSG